MDVQVTKLPESRVALKIELTPQDVEQALDRTYKQLVQRVTIPGFRKGKAPRSVVERVVGHEYFIHETTEEAIRWGYRRAIDQEHLVPIDEAEIEAGENGDHAHLDPTEPFHFEARVAVRPEVQLPDYHSLKVEREQVAVADQDVEELLGELRERNATLEPTARAGELGDFITMNVTGKIEGTEVVQRDDADFELKDEENGDPDPVFPGLSKQLLGANRGDIREAALPLPDLHPNDEWAGKTIFLRILVKEIKRKVLPTLNDELAQSVSELQTLDELRDALRRNLEVERRLEADEKLVGQAVEEVASRTFIDIPPVLIEEELDRMTVDLQNAFERRQMSWARYLEVSERSEEEIRTEMRDGAIRNVKTTLVLAAVAEAENLEVSNAEIDSALEEIFRVAQTASAERRRLRASTSVRSNIRSRLRRHRAILRLVGIMSGGDEVAPEAADAVADQTTNTPGETAETEETVAV
jgi:trigger factor